MSLSRLTNFLKYLKFLLRRTFFNLSAAMEYRGAFASQVVFMALNNAIFMVFWAILFNKFQTIGDWKFRNMVVLFGFSAMAFGYAQVLFGNSFQLARIIAEGQLDYYLTLPRHPLLHAAASRSSVSAIGDALFGIAMFLLAAHPGIGDCLFFAVLAFIAGMLMAAFNMLAACIAFYLGNSEGISSMLQNALLTFALYPEPLFGGAARLMLYTIIPAGIVAYIPVRLLDRFDAGLFLLFLAATAAIYALTFIVFKHGLKRYASGNLISMMG